MAMNCNRSEPVEIMWEAGKNHVNNVYMADYPGWRERSSADGNPVDGRM